MGQVFYLDLPGHLKLVLLSLADHARDDGSKVFPSVPRISVKCSIDTRTVQRNLRKLEELGFLQVVRKGGGRGHATEYQLVLKGGDLSPFVRETVTLASTKGDTHATPTISKPPESTPARKPRARDPMFDAIVTACGWGQMKLTRSEAGRVAKAKKELLEVGAIPELVLAFGDDWNRLYAGASITPQGLAANWSDYRSGKLRELAGKRENGHLRGAPEEIRPYDVDRIWAKIAEEEGVDA